MKKRIQVSLITILIAAFCISQTAYSQTDLSVRGSGRLFPIAVPQLCLQSGESNAVKEVPEVLSRDLDLSGYFEVLNSNSYIETPGKCSGSTDFAYSDWSVIGAEGLVKGVVSTEGSGLKIQLYLHDVLRRNVVLGKEYVGDPTQVRMIAHKFANEIMRFFTGEPGVFGTQIAFSSKVGRFKELFVMDMDGSNLRQVTNDKGLAISSSWDHTGSNLIYTSFRRRVPDLFLIDPSRRNVSQLTRGRELELGGKYSRDGSLILASRAEGRDSDIVLFNSDGTLYKRLTPRNGAIDVSPDWSPDERQISFVSNRSGGPQVYVMNKDGSNSRRISFVGSNYCTSPSWSPKGDKIAFVCRAERGFQIFSVNPDGSSALQLTSYGSNEDPDWSPNGRYIVFATTFGKGSTFHLAMMRNDGSNLRQLTTSRSGDYEPSWGPWLN